ncbi:hypothetical protein SacglDRAFT_03068 [Saccharomonospora glauca K62]|jgi:colicin import membrane protein|uniref:DivIVA protein n=1 Tax=Saccharomonospora glauca K62 TaxID=928724 RepID=I1D4R0_9PSEU|nr:hypothetical protein SacglDRAFT_03068 [Saccharomonospora glauca K62]
MTSAQDRNGWPQQPGEFRVTWRGYDRAQVRKYVRDLLESLHAVTADRDAAAQYVRSQSEELAALRRQNDKLRRRLDRVCRTPVEPDGLSERLWHMVDLAQREAEDILTEARAEADRRRAELDKRENELEERRAELEEQHRELVRRIKAEAAAEAERAERERRDADERAMRRRQELERDFAKNLAARREEMNRALARREAAAKAEAERIIAEATERAERLVAEATERVRALEEARRKAASELRAAREALVGAWPLLEPLPDEVSADRTGPKAVAESPESFPAKERKSPAFAGAGLPTLPAVLSVAVSGSGAGPRSVTSHTRVAKAEPPARHVVGTTVSSAR